MEIIKLLEKEFKVTIIKMLTELRGKMNSENLNKEMENIRKYKIKKK